MIMAIFTHIFPGGSRDSSKICQAILLDHNELDEALAMYQARLQEIRLVVPQGAVKPLRKP